MSFYLSSIYSASDLENIYDFSDEFSKPGRTLLRYICILSLLSCYYVTIIVWPLEELFTLFSNWTLHITTLSILLTISCSKDQNINHLERNEIKSKIAITHLMYTIAILFNLVVVSIYWTVIHPETMPKHRKNGPPLRVTCQYMIHIIPAICCLINTIITNLVLLNGILTTILKLSTFYLLINFTATKYHGTPIYSFLSWESWETPAIVVGLLVAFSALYLGMCKVDQVYKGEIIKQRREKIKEMSKID